MFDVMRNFLIALKLFLTASICSSQIGMNLDEVIEEHGTDYEVQAKEILIVLNMKKGSGIL